MMTHEAIVERLSMLHTELGDLIAELVPGQTEEPVSSPLNKPAFFACCREKFGKLKQEQVGPLEALLDMMVANPHRGQQQAAYLLATVKHETNDTYLPVVEAYWLSDAWRKKNLQYYPYYGRGYVQLTWKENYEKAGQALGIDLMNNPDEALGPQVAYEILLRGMLDGWFTSKKLGDYINDSKTDYEGARRVVNGTDRAVLIAGYAKKFEACLAEAGFLS